MKKLRLFLFTLIFATLFASCTNGILDSAFTETKATESYSIRCSISQDLNNSSNERTAFPSGTGNTYSYMVYYNCGNEEYSQQQQAYDGLEFEIKLPHKGLWSLRVYGAINGETVSSTQYILKSKKIYYMNITDETPSAYQKLIVIPEMTSGTTTGSINLKVGWATDSDINCVTYKIGDKVTEVPPLVGGLQYYELWIKESNVPSGSYNVEFFFYNDDGNGTKILKYNASEIINVFDGFETDTWVKHGDDEYLDDTGSFTDFEVTKELTRKFLLSSVYVDVNVAADAPQTGSFVAPFNSFDKAMTLVNNNFSKEGIESCTIFLRGDSTNHEVEITDKYTVPASKKLKIKSWDSDVQTVFANNISDKLKHFFDISGTLTIDNLIIDGKGLERSEIVLNIQNNASLELNNTTIRNFKLRSTSVIVLNNNRSLSISGKTVISDNTEVSGPKPKNIDLSGGTIKVNSITEDSRIGITTSSKPKQTTPVTFTNGFSSYRSVVKADEVFISDEGYYPAVNSATGEAALFVSGGQITPSGYDKIGIQCLTSKVINPAAANESGRKIIFKAYNNSTGEDVTSNASFTFAVKYLGADLPSPTYWGATKNVITFEGIIGYGIYNIQVTAVIDGKKYGSTQDVEVCQMNRVSDLNGVVPSATAASPVTLAVASQADLQQVSDWTRANKKLDYVTLVLEKDIECTDYQSIGAMKSSEIADENNLFCGILDGNGHVIKINTFSSKDDNSKALIAGTGGGSEIKNLILEGNIDSSSKNYVCGFVICPRGKTTISNCINRMNITGSGNNIAGFTLTGQTDELVIENCRNEGNISGKENISGFGTLNVVGGTIRNCVNTGKISGTGGNVAGFYHLASIDIYNCINRGEISGSTIVGGISGNASYNTNNSKGIIENCLNLGSISCTNGIAGGIVGELGGNSGNFIAGQIKNCVNLGTVTCSTPAITSVGSIVGKIKTNNTYTIKNNFYLKQDNLPAIGVTDTVDTSAFEMTAFTQGNSYCTASAYYNTYGAKSNDVVEMLNAWITSNSGGNDPNYITYSKWVYKKDISGKAYPYLSEVE